MNNDWLKMEMITIQDEKDSDGNHFITSFIRDYKKYFPADIINISCDKCFRAHYNKFINLLKNNIMSNSKKETTGKLHKKYEGIQMHFGSKNFITNATMTEEQAQYLLNKHPHGGKLFAVLPKAKVKTDSELNKDELITKYPEIDPKLNVKEFRKEIQAIKEAKKAEKKAKKAEKDAEAKAKKDAEGNK